MKTPASGDPSRWRERGDDAHALEARAALLAEAASEAGPLGREALARIRRDVLVQRSGGGRRLAPFPAHRRFAFAIGLLLVLAASAGGARVLWRKLRPPFGSAVAPRGGAPAPRTSARAPRPQAGASERIALVDPSETKADGPPATAPADFNRPPAAAPRPATTRVPVPAGESARPMETTLPPAIERVKPETLTPPPPFGAESSAAQARPTEAKLVAEALSALRQEHDPRVALSTLDRYAREFPHGVLEAEALRTRVEALVALHDLGAALSILDGVPNLATALGGDLLLMRAELRASGGRFREAAADLTDILDAGAVPLTIDVEERALYSRAVCLGRLGQDDRARLDLLAYRRRYPQGRFGAEVGRLLEGRPPSQRP